MERELTFTQWLNDWTKARHSWIKLLVYLIGSFCPFKQNFEFYLFSLRILLALSKKLKERRVGNGALVLASSEVRFSVDSETADPIDVQVVFLFIMYSTSWRSFVK